MIKEIFSLNTYTLKIIMSESNLPHIYAWYFSHRYIETYEGLVNIIAPGASSKLPLEIIINILTNVDPVDIPQVSNPRDFLSADQNRDLDGLIEFANRLTHCYLDLSRELYLYEREDYESEEEDEENEDEEDDEEEQPTKRQKIEKKSNKVISEEWAYCLVRDPNTPNIFPFLPYELRNNPHILKNAILRWKGNAAWSQLRKGNEAYFPHMAGFKTIYALKDREFYGKLILVPAYRNEKTGQTYTFAEFYFLTSYYLGYAEFDFSKDKRASLKQEQFDTGACYAEYSIDILKIKNGELLEQIDFESSDEDEKVPISLFAPNGRPLYEFVTYSDNTGFWTNFSANNLTPLVRSFARHNWFEKWDNDEEKTMNEMVNVSGFPRTQLQQAIDSSI